MAGADLKLASSKNIHYLQQKSNLVAMGMASIGAPHINSRGTKKEEDNVEPISAEEERFNEEAVKLLQMGLASHNENHSIFSADIIKKIT